MPKISVITVCFNAERYIEQTIDSVVRQKDVDLEYIIVDGDSTDRTLEIIKNFTHEVDVFISEPDSGIADAMNKGISLATGDYLIFLHADDFFVDDRAVFRAACKTNEHDEIDIYAFDVLFETQNQALLKRTRPFGFWTYFKTPVMHQGTLCSRELLNSLGGFNTDYKIVMDYDLFYRAYMQSASMKIIHETLSVMRDTGVSSRKDWPSLRERFNEERSVHSYNAPGFAMKLLYAAYWPTYLAYRRLMWILS